MRALVGIPDQAEVFHGSYMRPKALRRMARLAHSEQEMEVKTMFRFFATMSLLSACLVPLISCSTRNSDVPKPDPTMKHLAACLHQFLGDNRHRPELVELGVDQSSVEGASKEEKTGLFFIGQWTIRRTGDRYTAIWSRGFSGKAAQRLVLQIKCDEAKCSVVKWFVEDVTQSPKQ